MENENKLSDHRQRGMLLITNLRKDTFHRNHNWTVNNKSLPENGREMRYVHCLKAD